MVMSTFCNTRFTGYMGTFWLGVGRVPIMSPPLHALYMHVVPMFCAHVQHVAYLHLYILTCMYVCRYVQQAKLPISHVKPMYKYQNIWFYLLLFPFCVFDGVAGMMTIIRSHIFKTSLFYRTWTLGILYYGYSMWCTCYDHALRAWCACAGQVHCPPPMHTCSFLVP